MFDVSRTVVREAVRSLLGSGMITITSGRGVEVCYDPSAAKGGPMRLSVKELGELEYGTVHEIRVPIEVQAAALAAERASEADVANLRRIVELHATHIGDNDLEAAGDADLEFHDEIARLAGNPLLLGMYKTLAEVMKVVRTPVRHSAEVAESGLRAHRWLLECIAAGDPNAARGAMERHLVEAERIWSGEASPGP
jgi:GntR family transcriptional repressor for pyruvate dehydrogenase complex